MAIGVFLAAVCAVLYPQNAAGIEHDENNMIFLYLEENHDSSIIDKLVLTTKNVKDVIQYIQTIVPDFDFEEEYDTSDLGIEAFVDEFNRDGPEYCAIYLLGIEEYAGYSSVLSWLNGYINTDEPRLFSFHFFFDEEYSDTSGIMFSDYFSKTEDSETLYLWRKKYRDADDFYWEVIWPFDFHFIDIDNFGIVQLYSKEEKTSILTSFLTRIIDTKVFQNIDIDWFSGAYTSIEGNNQRIGDILWEMFNEYAYDEQVITYLQWLNGDNTATELAPGDAVTLSASTEKIDDGETVTITIWAKGGETDERIGEYQSRVKDNTIMFHWASPAETARAQSYYYTVSYDTVTSQNSALLNISDYKSATANRPAYYIVKRNDNLWNIAGNNFIYGNSHLWRTLYEANKHNFVDTHNPGLIEPGQVLIIPPRGNEIRTGTR
jgi:hypothetical protein